MQNTKRTGAKGVRHPSDAAPEPSEDPIEAEEVGTDTRGMEDPAGVMEGTPRTWMTGVTEE